MNVFPTIYNTLSGWMSRYPFTSKPTSIKPTVHSWGHSSTGSSCDSYEGRSQSANANCDNDLILAQMGMAWKQPQPQPQSQSQQRYSQHSSRPAVPLSPSPSTSSSVTEERLVEDPWRSHDIFVESQAALVAAQRRFLRAAVRATRTHLDGLVDQDEVAMFGYLYPDARARLNQGFSGQNHLRLDEWDHSLERARKQFGIEVKEIAQRMQYLHIDAIRELIGQVEERHDTEVEAVVAPLPSSSSTSLPTPATSPEPSRKRSLDDSDEKTVDIKAVNISRPPRPLKRARVEIIKTEDCDLAIPPALTLSSSAETEALMASSPSSAPSPPAPISPKRASQVSAPRRRRRTKRSTRSGTKKNH